MNLSNYLDMPTVWSVIIGWSALCLLAAAFNHGASDRLNDGEEPVGREA